MKLTKGSLCDMASMDEDHHDDFLLSGSAMSFGKMDNDQPLFDNIEFRNDADDLNLGNFLQIRDAINRLLDSLGPLVKPSSPTQEIDDDDAMGSDDEDAYEAEHAGAEHDDTCRPSPT
ncbi:hypothetical protein PIB30_012623 [Stylosanthes scabra]|uniref:Uncharacterized protein n=1 Tax=Stylosanthes scabra TaxID=79078 RepID=A0ABU6Y2Z2_9FABA|nr:hypothetical protein [Stylosanthes scabra]